MTTMSPGRSSGASICSIQARKMAPFIGAVEDVGGDEAARW